MFPVLYRGVKQVYFNPHKQLYKLDYTLCLSSELEPLLAQKISECNDKIYNTLYVKFIACELYVSPRTPTITHVLAIGFKCPLTLSPPKKKWLQYHITTSL